MSQWVDGAQQPELGGVMLRCAEKQMEKEMATHSSILTWRISCTKELGKLQTMGSQGSDMT